MADERTPRETAELQASTNRWMVAGLVLMGLFVLAFPLFRFYEPGRRADARTQQQMFLAQQGAEVFAANCESCHGAAGSGAVAPAIGAKEFLEAVTDDQLSQLIAVGIPGSEMVAYSNDFGGPLTSEEITAVTTFLRSLGDDAPSNPGWRTPLADSSLTGAELYVLACSRCHGSDRTGNAALGVPDLSAGSITLQESDTWMASRIAEGYREMPRFSGVLTRDQIMAIILYLRTGTDGPPTTTTTLPSEPTTTTIEANPQNDQVLALGEALFQRLAGGDGCQQCHGADGRGSAFAPDITGASRSGITNALDGRVPAMDFEEPLTSDEVEAVYRYLLWLTGRAG